MRVIDIWDQYEWVREGRVGGGVWVVCGDGDGDAVGGGVWCVVVRVW